MVFSSFFFFEKGKIIVGENRYSSPVYEDVIRRSIENPEKFWSEVGECVDWSKPWDKVLDDSDSPHTRWYVGGEINACHNTIDRHVAAGRGEKVALIHDSPQTSTMRHVTYAELLEKVSLLAGVLAELGVRRGDRVVIYMPLIPETIMAILATARLGAIHSVVFGGGFRDLNKREHADATSPNNFPGFAARELATRIDHAEPKVLISASCGLEPNKLIKYTTILDDAMELVTVQKPRCIIYQRENVWKATLSEDYIEWETALRNAEPHPCVPVEANDPLYILYTSGTTGE